MYDFSLSSLKPSFIAQMVQLWLTADNLYVFCFPIE